ncbi:MAG TPA: sulfotransferase family protein [Verrucomicrobiae bacterium]|nr:sulfotransferase family protein [Verrucomicrobiae bacterium]
MISHKYRCIFVEVPKTGSSSIRWLLGMPKRPHLNIWQTKYELENHWTRYAGPLDRVLSAAYLMVPRGVRQRRGARQFASYFKFGFVRNPWDRVVSLYERREGLQLSKQMSFEQFVDWIQFSSSTCIHPVPHRYQVDWFVDPHGTVLADFIGRFETLEEDWARIARILGIQEQLPHKNRNPRRTRHYTEYYSPDTRARIAEKFRVDIERFGYEFDGTESLPAYKLCADL